MGLEFFISLIFSAPQLLPTILDLFNKGPFNDVKCDLKRVAGGRDTHIVTQRFCCTLVKRFIEGKIDNDVFLIGDHSSTSHCSADPCQKLERYANVADLVGAISRTSGSPLSKACYGELLRGAALLKPKCAYAVWDFDVVKIDDVFESNGNLKDEWEAYRKTLTALYAHINNKSNTGRVFLFKDMDQLNRVKATKGWGTLMDWHDNVWHVPHREMLEGQVATAIEGNGCSDAILGDFVYFQQYPFVWRPESSWIIGRTKNGVGYLKYQGQPFTHTKKLCLKLIRSN